MKTKLSLKWLSLICLAAFIIILANCGGTAPQVQTEPPKPEPPKEPTIEALRKPVAEDPNMYQAVDVITNFGRLTKNYMSYEKFQQTAGAQGGVGAIDPDLFYDSYELPLNEKGYYATITFGTATRAIERDPRIEQMMKDLPEKSIFLKLQAPSGRTFILSDANADGILDFAKDERQKDIKIDVKLLDQMQEKYTWIMGLVKKHYKKK